MNTNRIDRPQGREFVEILLPHVTTPALVSALTNIMMGEPALFNPTDDELKEVTPVTGNAFKEINSCAFWALWYYNKAREEQNQYLYVTADKYQTTLVKLMEEKHLFDDWRRKKLQYYVL